jgi:hypothetical protein
MPAGQQILKQGREQDLKLCFSGGHGAMPPFFFHENFRDAVSRLNKRKQDGVMFRFRSLNGDKDSHMVAIDAKLVTMISEVGKEDQ